MESLTTKDLVIHIHIVENTRSVSHYLMQLKHFWRETFQMPHLQDSIAVLPKMLDDHTTVLI